MHNLLELKGEFRSKPNEQMGGGLTLPVGAFITSDKVRRLANELDRTCASWEGASLLDSVLIDVHYTTLVAKSNRVGRVFWQPKIKPSRLIVGARFSEDDCHIITYYVPMDAIRNSARELRICADYLDREHGGSISRDVFNTNNGTTEGDVLAKYGLARSNIRTLIVDSHYVGHFALPKAHLVSSDDHYRLVTVYKTEKSIGTLLEDLGIRFERKLLDDDTGLSCVLSKGEYEKLIDLAPYLVAMSFSGSFESRLSSMGKPAKTLRTIPGPRDEPTIGVIDTFFDDKAYFAKWVDATNDYPAGYALNADDFVHGTKVDSIIVDGPNLNPGIDDHCGRFRVRHFGVMRSGRTYSSQIIDRIRKIVSQNSDIHVWNLSLGGIAEINRSFISYEGAALDTIQKENNCLFVIAGTNGDTDHGPSKQAIAPPADSLNSLVVGSVNGNKQRASYSRHGPVLSNFAKPDVCYYGGENGMDSCTACGWNNQEDFFVGTSAAAPWIARKACYLIDVLKFPREIAKALIIDSAAGWNSEIAASPDAYLGYGVVPKTIEEILQCRDYEIRFYVYGKIQDYKTYNYSLPVPKDSSSRYPYIARATMCYFSYGNRHAGIDYTDTELALRFGRITDKEKIDALKSGKLSQETDGSGKRERELRKFFRKWDTVKLLFSTNKEELKSYEGKKWGIEVQHNERQLADDVESDDLAFGIVITLRELKEKDRLQSFIDECIMNNWVVTTIDIDARIRTYLQMQSDESIDD